ncbi:hypothetical protein LCGC14_0373850 [marine sediment metagenome]|uniref:Uncharacterized protein n=1 Tax=marine sediment metagenome TaxID=412755 RepID=A0A0F9TAF8_9ZZZZ
MPLLFLLKFLPFLLKLKGPAKIAGVFLKGNWDKVLVAVGIILLATLIHFKNNTIDRQEAVIASYVVILQKAAEANLTNQKTIDSLESANASFAEAMIVREEVRAAASVAAADRARRAQIRLDDTRTQLRDLENETPTCADISRIDIGAACPLSTELMRRAAAGDFDRN